ncbi:MAG: hypothetical protein WA664_15960 [Candidatus Acidiferrales bacterium]
MQRVQAILLVLALFAAPLALLARVSSGIGSECGNLCCLRHGPHAAHSHADRTDSKEEGMACHHGEAGHAMYCSMRAGHHSMDYGFLAPVAPTAPSAFVRVALPAPSRATFAQTIDSFPSGFIVAPFEPPRS